MGSVCISNCVKDTRIPVRATYVNLYKWPESDVEFVKAVGSASMRRGVQMQQQQQQPKVVDSVSCRQLYLRSYTFSRKETVPERTRKCIGRVKDKVARGGKKKKNGSGGRRRMGLRRVKELSCTALCAVFQRLLSCTSTVDVVDHPTQRD